MKIKFYLIGMIFLLFGTCFSMSGEVGQNVIDVMKLSLKESCLDLLASSELVDWDTLEKRVKAVKDAIADFENKISKLKGPSTPEEQPITSTKVAPAMPEPTPMPEAPEQPAAPPVTQPTPTSAAPTVVEVPTTPTPTVTETKSAAPAPAPQPIPVVTDAPVAAPEAVPMPQ